MASSVDPENRKHKETEYMEQSKQYRKTTQRASAGRIAAAALALGGLSASLLPASTAAASTNHAATSAPKKVVISTLKTKKYGTVLVDGKTLYTLKPGKTGCGTACHAIWPQVLLPKGVSKATAGTGVSSGKLGTVKVAGGALQVTYSGMALYWFVGDKAPGQVNGNVSDTWGKWSDVATVKPTTPPSTGGVSF
jgi:predicted lipoprotein with Yx(FWY)xxD motif